jgi:hypothetical protein
MTSSADAMGWMDDSNATMCKLQLRDMPNVSRCSTRRTPELQSLGACNVQPPGTASEKKHYERSKSTVRLLVLLISDDISSVLQT